MKIFLKLMVSILFCFVVFSEEMFASELGFFGGVSDGEALPKIMDRFVPTKKETKKVFQYKEVIFLTPKPTEVSGTITITVQDDKVDQSENGVFVEEYHILAENADKTVTLDRKVRLNTAFRKQENAYSFQVIKDSKLTGWQEVIKTADNSFTVDAVKTTFSKSTAEDITPGVRYYTTDTSYVLRYSDKEKKEYRVTMNGKITGFRQTWSKTESQVLEMNIDSPETGFYRDIQIKPKLQASRSIYYENSDPYSISFSGTYNQRLERKGTLSYEIRNYEPRLTQKEKTNEFLLFPSNTIEKLQIPKKLEFVEGHWAEEDIKQLYSLGIYTEIPHNGMQYEAMSRGEFVKALCLAMNIDTSKYEKPKKNALQLFGDVPQDHPMYPYIMAAYDTRMVDGTGADFSVDRPITRQEAFTIYIRVIGLERLGTMKTIETPFRDDKKIAKWAKREIMAGYKIGVIQGDENGYVHPANWLSKAEAASIINRLIAYLRTQMGAGY